MKKHLFTIAVASCLLGAVNEARAASGTALGARSAAFRTGNVPASLLQRDRQRVAADRQKLQADLASGNTTQIAIDQARIKRDLRTMRGDSAILGRRYRRARRPARPMVPPMIGSVAPVVR